MSDHKNLLEWSQQPRNQIVSQTLKRVLLAFSLIFWILGALFAAIGGWHLSQTRGYKDITDLATDVYAMFAALGCLVLVVSSFGVLGTLRENICLLRMYKISLCTVLVLQLCAGMIGFAFWPEIKKSIDTNIRSGIRDYVDNPRLRNLMDRMQRGIGCCGSLNVMDWDSNGYYRCKYVGSYRSCGVPWSCCLRKFQRNRQCGNKIRKKRSKVDIEKYIHTVGCLDKFFELMRKHMYLIGGITCGTLIVLLSGILMSHRFVKQIKKMATKYNDANESNEWQGSPPAAEREEGNVDFY